MKVEIRKLDRGYLIIQDDEMQIGVSGEDHLEAAIHHILQEKTKVKESMYFQGHQSMTINIEVDVSSKNLCKT